MTAESRRTIPALPTSAAQITGGVFRALLHGLWLCAYSVLAIGALATPSLAQDSTEAELRCLALTIYHEARGEPDSGKLAVAHVIINRVKDRRHSSSICDVVYEGASDKHGTCEFSWTCDGVSDRPGDLVAWFDSVRVATLVYRGRTLDPTGGALWYHADYVAPAWAGALSQPLRLGHHLFYRAKNGPAVKIPTSLAPARAAREAGTMPSGPAFRPSDATKSFPAALRVTMVILAADRRERTARINRVMYHEGDEIAPGVTLEEIAASAIVIWYQGRRFRLVL